MIKRLLSQCPSITLCCKSCRELCLSLLFFISPILDTKEDKGKMTKLGLYWVFNLQLHGGPINKITIGKLALDLDSLDSWHQRQNQILEGWFNWWDRFFSAQKYIMGSQANQYYQVPIQVSIHSNSGLWLGLSHEIQRSTNNGTFGCV